MDRKFATGTGFFLVCMLLIVKRLIFCVYNNGGFSITVYCGKAGYAVNTFCSSLCHMCEKLMCTYTHTQTHTLAEYIIWIDSLCQKKMITRQNLPHFSKTPVTCSYVSTFKLIFKQSLIQLWWRNVSLETLCSILLGLGCSPWKWWKKVSSNRGTFTSASLWCEQVAIWTFYLSNLGGHWSASKEITYSSGHRKIDQVTVIRYRSHLLSLSCPKKDVIYFLGLNKTA